jgi:hypothetical protein
MNQLQAVVTEGGELDEAALTKLLTDIENVDDKARIYTQELGSTINELNTGLESLRAQSRVLLGID